MYRNKRSIKRSYKLNNQYSASYIAKWIKGKSSKSTITHRACISEELDEEKTQIQFCEGANTPIGGGL